MPTLLRLFGDRLFVVLFLERFDFSSGCCNLSADLFSGINSETKLSMQAG
jgi:hypothetical protein